MNQDSYNSNSLGFDQPQPLQSLFIHQPPQELSIPEMEDLKQQYLDELKHLSNLEYHDENKIVELTENFNGMSIETRKRKSFYNWSSWQILALILQNVYILFAMMMMMMRIAVTPVLSIEAPDNSLNMGDEHLDNIPATESDEVIKSSVENLILIPNQFEDPSESNNEFSSIDDDSFSIENIDYVEASPPIFELVSLEVGGIDDDILLTIKDDILREKLLNVNLLIAKIKALNDNPTPSSNYKTKSSSTFLNSLLEETNTCDNSLPEFETFCFEVPTTHFDSSLYASFIFDLSINPFPPADRSDFYEFTDELIPFISPPEYDCFLFKVEPNSRDFTKDVVEDISPKKEPQVHNAFPTHPTLQLNIKFQPSSESLFTYVV
nr:hypothetical protein [Tanacetum cinerariifolium]